MVEKLKLLDWAPYIKGVKKFPEKEERAEFSEMTALKFLELLKADNIAKELLSHCMHYKDFFNAAVDFAHEIPKNQWEEVFYLAKNGGKRYGGVPSFCTYVLSETWKTSYGIPNLVVKQIPQVYLELFCSEGYLSYGLTLCDVINNVCSREYVPLSHEAPNHANSKFGEIYVSATDMVMAVPLDIYNVIGRNGLVSLEVTSKDILFGGKPVRTLEGYAGATHSLYDLRDIL